MAGVPPLRRLFFLFFAYTFLLIASCFRATNAAGHSKSLEAQMKHFSEEIYAIPLIISAIVNVIAVPLAIVFAILYVRRRKQLQKLEAHNARLAEQLLKYFASRESNSLRSDRCSTGLGLSKGPLTPATRDKLEVPSSTATRSPTENSGAWSTTEDGSERKRAMRKRSSSALRNILKTKPKAPKSAGLSTPLTPSIRCRVPSTPPRASEREVTAASEALKPDIVNLLADEKTCDEKSRIDFRGASSKKSSQKSPGSWPPEMTAPSVRSVEL